MTLHFPPSDLVCTYAGGVCDGRGCPGLLWDGPSELPFLYWEKKVLAPCVLPWLCSNVIFWVSRAENERTSERPTQAVLCLQSQRCRF